MVPVYFTAVGVGAFIVRGMGGVCVGEIGALGVRLVGVVIIGVEQGVLSVVGDNRRCRELSVSERSVNRLAMCSVGIVVGAVGAISVGAMGVFRNRLLTLFALELLTLELSAVMV
jgi:hypothetical protein